MYFKKQFIKKNICTYSSYLHIGLLQNPDCFVDLTHTFGWDLEELSLISTYFLWDDRKTLCKSFPESKSYRDKVLSSLKTNRHGLKLLSFKSGRPRVSWMGPIQNSCNLRIEIYKIRQQIRKVEREKGMGEVVNLPTSILNYLVLVEVSALRIRSAEIFCMLVLNLFLSSLGRLEQLWAVVVIQLTMGFLKNRPCKTQKVNKGGRVSIAHICM